MLPLLSALAFAVLPFPSGHRIEVSAASDLPTLPSQSIDRAGFGNAMRSLWSDHMQWTYATIDAFYHNRGALQATLARLLQNQKDIGAAMVPFYGQAAGDQLAKLLTTHIQQAVPVLEAAKAGDQAALDKALAAWYANAREIAGFLTAANPKHWPASATEPALKDHISQTTTYAVDLLKGNYQEAIKNFGTANDHMLMVADILSKGIVAQFPGRFN